MNCDSTEDMKSAFDEALARVFNTAPPQHYYGSIATATVPSWGNPKEVKFSITNPDVAVADTVRSLLHDKVIWLQSGADILACEHPVPVKGLSKAADRSTHWGFYVGVDASQRWVYLQYTAGQSRESDPTNSIYAERAKTTMVNKILALPYVSYVSLLKGLVNAASGWSQASVALAEKDSAMDREIQTIAERCGLSC